MAKEILYRIEFEGSAEQIKNLTKIGDELNTINAATKALQKEQKLLNEFNKDLTDEQKKQLEELKIKQKLASENYRQEQNAVKNLQKDYKAQAGTLAQLRLEAQRLGRQLETTWKVGSPEFNKAANQLDLLNRKIREADKSSGNFKSNIGNYAGSIGDAFQGVGINVGKLTGSLGAATMATGPLGIGFAALAGGAQLFGGAIKATDDLADKFAITLEKGKAASQVFFKALSDGDFSNFITNIKNATRAAEEYSIAIDRLGDLNRSLAAQEAAAAVAIAAQRKILQDKTATDDQRIAAGKEILRIEKDLSDKRVKYAKLELDTNLKYTSVINKISQEKLQDLLLNYDAYEIQINAVAALSRAESDLAKERAKSTGATSAGAYGSVGVNKSDAKEIERLEAVIAKATKMTAGYSEEIKALGKVSEEEREKIIASLVKKFQAQASFDENTLRSSSRLNTLLAEGADDQAKAAAASVKNIDLQAKQLEKLRDEAIKTDQVLTKLASTLAGGAIRNIRNAGLGKEFTPEATIAGRSVSDLGLTPEARKSGLKVNIGEEETEAAKFTIDNALQTSTQFLNIWQDAYTMQSQARQQALDQQLQAGLISEDKYNKAVGKLKAEQAKKDKTAALIGIAINTAQSIIKTGADLGYPTAIPFQVIAGILGAAQAAIVASQPIPKYATGGLVVGGNSHATGGTKFVGSDGSQFEAERDEVLAIVNKHDSRTLRTLSDINSRHGKSFYGQPRGSYFASGGIFQPNKNIGNVDTTKMIRDIVSQVGAIPVEVSLNEIENKAATKRKVNVIGAL